LILRLRTPATNLNGIPNLQIENVLTESQWRRIDILISPEDLQIQIDGTSRLLAPLPARPLSVWADNYVLALGNEMSFDRPWLGEIRRAEINVGQKTLDYARIDSLTLRRQYSVPRHNCLVHVPLYCSELNQRHVLDWLLNIFGFMPFGFLVARLFPHRHAIGNATLASLVLSLSMEAGQIFLQTRNPSSEDLLLNVFGGALGAILAVRIFRPS
jgi:VanZ family protein